jgi:hypothetical protein
MDTPREEIDKLYKALELLKSTVSKIKPFDIKNYVDVKISRATTLDKVELLGDIENLTETLKEILELEELSRGKK